MRTALLLAFLFSSVNSFAQKDYFYAENLIWNESKYQEANVVLDHLIDSGAYAHQPRFAMMTLNLAGTTKQYLKDTSGAEKCFQAAMACYDTLSKPQKSDDWNQREYYIAGEHLARIRYRSGNWRDAQKILNTIGFPGSYYSSTGSDVLDAEDRYCGFQADIYQRLNQPDSAFKWILKIRDNEYMIVGTLDSIFNDRSNQLTNVRCVYYTQKSIDQNIKSPGYLYFVAWSDSLNTKHSLWFVNPEFGQMRVIGRSTWNMEDPNNFPGNCYDMSLSPDEKYLAVACYTEGSNNIEVFSFGQILNDKKCVTLHSLLAYPASINIKGWYKSQLWLECEADLTKLNKKERLSYSDYPKDNAVMQEYLFDPEVGKFTHK